jgi:peptide/nickel transport system substrate-binding protein
MTIPEQDQFADLLGDTEFNKEFKCVSYYGPGTPFFYIGWNEGTLFFADRRVRLAMTHIVDRDKVVSELAKGIGRVITGPYYIDGPQNDPNISPWPHDLARANELLDEAGWRDSDGDGIRDKDGVPFRFKFLYAVDAIIYERLARLLKDECAKAGIDVIADPTEWSVLLPRLSDRKFEAMVMGWGGDIVEDNYQLFHSSQIGNRGSNYVGFRNTDADALLEEIRRTINDDRRNELCHRLHRIIHDEQPYTFLYVRPELRLVDRRFENVRVHKLGLNYREWHVPKQKQRYK